MREMQNRAQMHGKHRKEMEHWWVEMEYIERKLMSMHH